MFDGTLEPALGIAMEGARFVTTYSRAAAQRVADKMDKMKLLGTGLPEDRAARPRPVGSGPSSR